MLVLAIRQHQVALNLTINGRSHICDFSVYFLITRECCYDRNTRRVYI